ncbi:MAG: ADP-ribosylglycohydrolase family protein, partial [Saprospiraceae bacterium]
ENKWRSKWIENKDFETDPCLQTGEGWIAEEAFATALLCFLLYPNNAVDCLRRAANTSGDSDSIACIAGAMSGAYLGIDAFPKDWIERIEYQETLEEMVTYFSKPIK